jgi:exopolysaccharide production protein ExoZ
VSTGAQQPFRIDGIQYLRAVAALMVVVHHARHYFPQGDHWSTFGSRGVDIFFVISGFVMAHSTQDYRADANRRFQAARFLAKRFIRVVPLYWLALLWTSKHQLFAGQWGWDTLQDLLFIPHFHRTYQDAIFPLLIPGWTINYEMFFYALFALSMLVGKYRYALVAGVLVALASLGTLPWRSAIGIFYTSNVVLEFLFGIVVYAAVVRWPAPMRRPWLVLVTVVAAGLLAIENRDAVRGFADGPFAALIVWSTVLWSQGLRSAPLRRLGDASYSIYLFHLASFWLPAALLHRLGVESTTPLVVAGVLLAHVLVATMIGLAIHRVIEQPLLEFLRRRLDVDPKGDHPILAARSP